MQSAAPTRMKPATLADSTWSGVFAWLTASSACTSSLLTLTGETCGGSSATDPHEPSSFSITWAVLQPDNARVFYSMLCKEETWKRAAPLPCPPRSAARALSSVTPSSHPLSIVLVHLRAGGPITCQSALSSCGHGVGRRAIDRLVPVITTRHTRNVKHVPSQELHSLTRAARLNLLQLNTPTLHPPSLLP